MSDLIPENPLNVNLAHLAADGAAVAKGLSEEPLGIVTSLRAGGRQRAAGGALPRGSVSPISADRPVFTLSVAADLLGMHPRTLRIYEEEGLVVPARTETKRRRYSQNDIRRFQFIQHLTQGLRVNLAGVRIILEMMTVLDGCGIDFTARLYEMSDQNPTNGKNDS